MNSLPHSAQLAFSIGLGAFLSKTGELWAYYKQYTRKWVESQALFSSKFMKTLMFSPLEAYSGREIAYLEENNFPGLEILEAKGISNSRNSAEIPFVSVSPPSATSRRAVATPPKK